MTEVIECDPAGLVSAAGAWLEREPVLHNVICSVVQQAIRRPGPFGNARWFMVQKGSDPVGVAIMTPPFPLTLTPMAPEHLRTLADALVDALPSLPGVSGPGDTPGRFAELWAERTGAGVELGMSQLMYRLDAVVPPPPADGKLRLADTGDRELLCEWFDAFVREAGAVGGDIGAAVDRRVADGSLYLWEHTDAVTMVGVVPAVAGVVRVGPVFTPPELRRRGYATNCTAAVSQRALDAGARACMLFTDEANPTSNGIYSRIGYRPVATASEYRFL
jgi:RimJ/RimL family protein N-acetyltransferase